MTNKKRVLFLLEAFDKGGIEKVTLDIVNHLDPDKYDITVQTFWYGGHCQSLVNENVKVIPFFFRRYVRGIIRLIEYLPSKWLYRLFVRGDYDVEIAASDGGAAKVISGSTSKAKKICWVHMDVMKRGSRLKEFKTARTAYKIYSKFDLIVPVSDACKHQFIHKFGTDYEIRVVRNPIPVESILEKSLSFVPKMPSNKLNFVCIGRLAEEKGFDRLMDAVAHVKLETKNFHIYIAGEGPNRKELEETIQKLKLENFITLLGFCENPYPYLKYADAFLLSSRDEACPLVVGESLVIGTPVLATDCSGISEWLESGKYGMIVHNSTNGIRNALQHVLLHPEILDEYRKSITVVQQKYSFDQSLLEFETILR